MHTTLSVNCTRIRQQPLPKLYKALLEARRAWSTRAHNTARQEMFQQRLHVDRINTGGSSTSLASTPGTGGSSTSTLSPSGTRRPSTTAAATTAATTTFSSSSSAAAGGANGGVGVAGGHTGGSSTSVLSPSGTRRPSAASITIPAPSAAATASVSAAAANAPPSRGRSSGIFGFLGARNSHSRSSSRKSNKHKSGKLLPEGWEVSPHCLLAAWRVRC